MKAMMQNQRGGAMSS
jgi:hypothetical protein